MMKLNKKNKYKITLDSSANLKLLKALEKQGYVEINNVMLENGRETKKVKNKILPTLVLNHSILGESVLGGSDNIYENIRKIIGYDHVKDAMHLEAHIRNNHDYFITEDKDFLNKREELEKKFNIKIKTPEELQKICK